jgi:hypothetical protein
MGWLDFDLAQLAALLEIKEVWLSAAERAKDRLLLHPCLFVQPSTFTLHTLVINPYSKQIMGDKKQRATDGLKFVQLMILACVELLSLGKF